MRQNRQVFYQRNNLSNEKQEVYIGFYDLSKTERYYKYKSIQADILCNLQNCEFSAITAFFIMLTSISEMRRIPA